MRHTRTVPGPRTSRARRRTRPLLLYLRARHVAATLTAAVGSTAVLWSVAAALDDRVTPRDLGLTAVAVSIAVAGHGLCGPGPDLDRTAAIDWRPRRLAHIALVAAVALGIVATTALTAHPLGPLAGLARNAVGTGGLLALAATTLGAHRSWIPPLLWTMTALQALEQLWPTPDPPGYAQIATWPAQPTGSALALTTALALAAAGAAAYATLGSRP